LTRGVYDLVSGSISDRIELRESRNRASNDDIAIESRAEWEETLVSQNTLA
jgi:hypothetical protein